MPDKQAEEPYPIKNVDIPETDADLIKSGATRYKIYDELEKGATPRMAAQAGGIPYETMMRWLAIGEKELVRRNMIESGEVIGSKDFSKNKFVVFYQKTHEAMAARDSRLIAWGFDSASLGTPQGIKFVQWYLEKIYPETFGQRTETTIHTIEQKRDIQQPSIEVQAQIRNIVSRQSNESVEELPPAEEQPVKPVHALAHRDMDEIIS